MCSADANAYLQLYYKSKTYGPDLTLYPITELPVKGAYTLAFLQKHSSQVPSLNPLTLSYGRFNWSKGVLDGSGRMLENEFPYMGSEFWSTID
jgi:hypothetical protein